MERFFTIDEKKYVLTGEFTKQANNEMYERVNIYNKEDKKISSNLYSCKKINDMIKKAAKQKNKK